MCGRFWLPKCFGCHGPDAQKREADLRLDVEAGATMKLSSGNAAVVPKHPEQSELVARINSTDNDLRMPPADSKLVLSSKERKTLERWIAQGAGWQKHWAFVAPRRPDPPVVRGTKWIRNPIDRFTLRRLEERKLTASREASRHTLARRVSLDLLGIPPTADERAAVCGRRIAQCV